MLILSNTQPKLKIQRHELVSHYFDLMNLLVINHCEGKAMNLKQIGLFYSLITLTLKPWNCNHLIVFLCSSLLHKNIIIEYKLTWKMSLVQREPDTQSEARVMVVCLLTYFTAISCWCMPRQSYHTRQDGPLPSRHVRIVHSDTSAHRAPSPRLTNIILKREGQKNEQRSKE